MPQKQAPAAAAAAVDRIASKRMGVEPAAPAAPQDPAAQQPAAQQQPSSSAPQKETDQDRASEQGSPSTEGDKSQSDAVLYEVEFGEGKKRHYTPAQIRSMAERYALLNFRNQQYKPVLEVVENLLKSDESMTPKQLADTIKNLSNADGPSTFGRQSDTNGDGKTQSDQHQSSAEGTSRKNVQSNEDLAAQLTKWEEDNAASLPPGYKEMLTANNAGQQTMAQMSQQMQAMQQMLTQVLAQAQGTAEAARAGVQQADQGQSRAMVKTIQNNLDRLQQAMGLPDEAAEDFMAFAGERGYTFEDFIDPDLLGRVMQDFKANMDGPEMERIRDIHKRRQAFTGSLGSAPQSGGPASEEPEGGATLGRLTDRAIERRIPR